MPEFAPGPAGAPAAGPPDSGHAARAAEEATRRVLAALGPATRAMAGRLQVCASHTRAALDRSRAPHCD